ncbi:MULTISPECIES: hypoxanthine phosphoribosyltransferase [Fusobacterium]|uniref:hypoxanthine phosphoribosyltransferase n=1 Tax=Fusobacterium TaxID=848 RepID=UPI001F1C6EA2|nr:MULTISPECIES: hypoxanthine phosphoribosyltransferase [Fusobacterium]MCF2612448.1 hypoxanthine phosphoribosyltransferase [Fusobacterium perfoetens]MDY2981204.1 hypoxanthine phosphoribosyltransferase [Fusobacterium sp.]
MANKIETLISEEKLAARVAELGKQIEKDYQGKDLICVGLLKGSVVFMTDLIKTINLDLKIDFMKVSSYGNGTDSTGIVKILKDVDEEVTGKDVLLIEDIVDTGLTLANVKEFMWKKKPNSIKICTLLDKPSRRKADVKAEYVGFEIPDAFVIGYGLDYAEHYRNLPFVGVLTLGE